MTNSEWDDIPTSSELFGGDFFGDELMEMYTADHGLNLGDNSASVITTSSASATAAAAASTDDDAHKHPGVLVAMNAMAMDGGLSPLGASPEFAPIAGPSDTSLPLYPTQPVEAAVHPTPINTTAPAPPEAVAAPVPTVVSSAPLAVATAAVAAKRPVAFTAPQGPSKKPKVMASPLQSLAVAPVQVNIATYGGVKVAIPPIAPAARPVGRVFSQTNVAQVAKAPIASAGIRVPGVALLKKPVVPAVKSTVIPKAKMPVGTDSKGDLGDSKDSSEKESSGASRSVEAFRVFALLTGTALLWSALQ